MPDGPQPPPRLLTFCLPVVCGSSASGLRPRPQLQGQERQMRRLRRRQLVVQNHGRDLQRRAVRSVPIAVLCLSKTARKPLQIICNSSGVNTEELWHRERSFLYRFIVSCLNKIAVVFTPQPSRSQILRILLTLNAE